MSNSFVNPALVAGIIVGNVVLGTFEGRKPKVLRSMGVTTLTEKEYN